MISPEVIAEATKYAVSVFPKEAVGYATETAFVPLKNTAKNPEEDFAVNFKKAPEFYTDAIALVHSHTNGFDGPSPLDMKEQALMDIPWFVIVLEKNGEDIRHINNFWMGGPIQPYVGREFRHGVADCYALVRDWYKQEKNIDLPVIPREPKWWQGKDDLIKDLFPKVGFVEVAAKEVQVGDLIAMSIGGSKINHLGVYIGHGEMLHHLMGRMSRREAVIRWANHTSGRYLRYVGA